MTPNATEVAASNRNTSWKEWFARKPAAAPPRANPRLTANRRTAKPVTRLPAGSRSASRAPAAGRYSSDDSPANSASSRITTNDRAWDSPIMAAALANIDRTMVPRRPNRSARWPPTKPADSSPTPYAASAAPDSVIEKCRWRMYSTRNTATNEPNWLMNEPTTRYQTGVGRSRMFWRIVRCALIAPAPSPQARRLPHCRAHCRGRSTPRGRSILLGRSTRAWSRGSNGTAARLI